MQSCKDFTPVKAGWYIILFPYAFNHSIPVCLYYRTYRASFTHTWWFHPFIWMLSLLHIHSSIMLLLNTAVTKPSVLYVSAQKAWHVMLSMAFCGDKIVIMVVWSTKHSCKWKILWFSGQYSNTDWERHFHKHTAFSKHIYPHLLTSQLESKVVYSIEMTSMTVKWGHHMAKGVSTLFYAIWV